MIKYKKLNFECKIIQKNNENFEKVSSKHYYRDY